MQTSSTNLLAYSVPQRLPSLAQRPLLSKRYWATKKSALVTNNKLYPKFLTGRAGLGSEETPTCAAEVVDAVDRSKQWHTVITMEVPTANDSQGGDRGDAQGLQPTRAKNQESKHGPESSTAATPRPLPLSPQAPPARAEEGEGRRRKTLSPPDSPGRGQASNIYKQPSATSWRRARRSASPCLAERTPPPTGPSLHPPVAKASDLKTPK